MNQEPIGRRVYERHLDLILAEEFECRPDFFAWMLATIRGSDDPKFPDSAPSSVSVDVSHDDDIALESGAFGENDLLVEATWANGTRVRLLVEDKLDAVLQPGQPERYVARAAAHAALDDVDVALAVIVAPAAYLERFADDLGGLRSVSIDEIADHFRDAADDYPGVADRLRWRADRLVTLRERRTIAAPDHPGTVSAREWLLPRLTANEPALRPRGSSLRTINTGWLYFHEPEALVYKIIHGYVDIYLKEIWPDEEARQALAHQSDDHPVGFEPATDTAGNLILRRVVHTPMPLADIWNDDEPTRPADLIVGVAACGDAARWIQRAQHGERSGVAPREHALRIVAWNAARRGATSSDALAELAPDVAVLPEWGKHPMPEPAGATSFVEFGSPDTYEMAVAGWGEWTAQRAAVPDIEGTVVGAVDVTGPRPFCLIAVWSYLSGNPTINPLTEALDAWRGWYGGKPLVVAGDFNTGAWWTKIRTGPKSHYPLIEQLEALGLHSAYHVAHDVQQGVDEAATHWHSSGNSYTIDHIFTPNDWPITEVTIGAEDPWRTRSDHAPVTVELRWAS